MKREFNIGDLLLHQEDKENIIGWIKDKQDFGFGYEYAVEWADGYINSEWYGIDWIETRVRYLHIHAEERNKDRSG